MHAMTLVARCTACSKLSSEHPSQKRRDCITWAGLNGQPPALLPQHCGSSDALNMSACRGAQARYLNARANGALSADRYLSQYLQFCQSAFRAGTQFDVRGVMQVCW